MSQTGDKPVAVVVDGYSAGNFLPAAFAEFGATLIHLQSTPELIPTMQPPNLADYHENIICPDEDEAVRLLRDYAPTCLLPGQESCVQLADRLSAALGVPSNGTRLSPARRNKYEMIEALRRAGLRCAGQFKSSDLDALVDWAQQAGGYPVVVKPISSAATDGVYICHDAGQVRAAAESVLASRDIFGMANTEVLVQTYLAGTEYIVDTVSCDGHRYVCGVWRYEKSLLPSGRNIYDKDILVDADSEVVADLVAYIDGVLDALDIRWGPAHSEVIVTKDGPVLVELGARLNGNLNPGFHDVCLGTNAASLTARAYLRPEEFRREFGGGIYRTRQPGVVYNVPTTFDGIVDSIDEEVVQHIQALPSVYLAVVKLRPGARIRPTVDLLTSPIRVFLTHPDEKQIEADYEEIRRLKDSVYRVR